MFDISALKADESFWDSVSTVATVFVFIGVALESVADFRWLARLVGLSRNEHRREFVAKSGLLILIAALGVEVPAAIRGHEISQDINQGLNDEIRQTQDRENTLISAVDSLSRKGLVQEAALESLGNKSTDFEKEVDAQKERYDRALKLLRSSEGKLDRAQADATTSAGKAASAAAASNKAAEEMNKTLLAEQSMQESMRRLVTPRVLSDSDLDELSAALKQFANTPFDLFANDDFDSKGLVGRIGTLLKKANWDWEDSPGIFISWNYEGKSVSGVTFQGLTIETAASSIGKYGPAMVALANALSAKGITAQLISNEDEKMGSKFARDRVHIFVGSR